MAPIFWADMIYNTMLTPYETPPSATAQATGIADGGRPYAENPIHVVMPPANNPLTNVLCTAEMPSISAVK